jgi:penicillin-insensitive murein DD-endopeptidase
VKYVRTLGRRATHFILLSAIALLSACGGNLGGSSDFNSEDEMTGLYDPKAPPPEMPVGEAWTYGPSEQARGYYACEDRQRARGIFTCGTLVNPDQIPAQGQGFRLAIPASKFAFATYDLIKIITAAAAAIDTKYFGQEELRVGELSKFKGGNASGHGSHQNGLDIDLGYYRTGKPPLPEIEKYMLDAMVIRGKVVKLFDYNRNYDLVKFLVSTGRANRIFVHAKVKAGLCLHAKKLGEDTKINPYLSVLRAYPNHADHMHVRITCPRNSPKCKEQPLPAAEAGC